MNFLLRIPVADFKRDMRVHSAHISDHLVTVLLVDFHQRDFPGPLNTGACSVVEICECARDDNLK